MRAYGTAFLLAAGALLLLPQTAAAERLALVVSGDAGSADHADSVASALAAAGFRAVSVAEPDAAALRQAIAGFAADAAATGEENVLVFFYAGEALQRDGRNYLVPADGALGADRLIPLDAYFDATGGLANAANVVALEQTGTPNLPTDGTGLAEVDLSALAATLFVMATDPGLAVPPDHAGIFTEAFAAAFGTPAGDVESLVWEATQAVAAETGYQQIPWSASSLAAEVALGEPDGAAIGDLLGGLLGGAWDEPVEDMDAAAALIPPPAPGGAASIALADDSGGEPAPPPPPAAAAAPGAAGGQVRATPPPRLSAAAPPQHRSPSPVSPGSRHQDDAETWRWAATADTVDAYRKYLAIFPEGRCAKLADRRIAQLERNVVLVSLQKSGGAAQAIRQSDTD